MFKGHKIVDLSPELVPGKEDRRLAIREYIFELDKTYMHDIDMMSHIGAHIEAPSHYKKHLTDVSRLPLSSFIGEAVCLNVKSVGKAKPILPEHVKKISKTGVKKNDILILYSPYKGKDIPFISLQLAEWMAKLPVKLLGIANSVGLEEPKRMFTHDFLMRKDIAIIERIENLDKVPERFIFIGFPLRIKGLDSSPIRAVALVKR
jgi:kynurenine formamidase